MGFLKSLGCFLANKPFNEEARQFMAANISKCMKMIHLEPNLMKIILVPREPSKTQIIKRTNKKEH